MGPINAIKSAFSKYITFKGRASRSEFWWFVIVTTLVLFAMLFIELPAFVRGISPQIHENMSEAELTAIFITHFLQFFPLTLGWILLTYLPSVSVTVRRLHDSNISGWFYWTSFIPYIGIFIILYLVSRAPRNDDNRFGPPPFGPAAKTEKAPEKPKVAKVPKTGRRFARKSKPRAGKTKYADLVRPRAPLHTGPMHHSAE